MLNSLINLVNASDINLVYNGVMTVKGDSQNILEDLTGGNFQTTVHALDQGAARTVTRRDIQSVGKSAKSCVKQSNGNWKVKGKDSDGDDLTVICAYDGQTWIVTVY